MLAHPYFQYNRQPTCPSNHNLIKIDDICQLHAFRSYTLNTYSCHVCQNVFSTKSASSYHCVICKFNLCPDCYQDKKSLLESSAKQCQPQKKNQKPVEAHENVDKTLCVMCFAEERNWVFSPCMHLCCCEKCCKNMVDDKLNCPICRNPIQSSFKIYYS